MAVVGEAEVPNYDATTSRDVGMQAIREITKVRRLLRWPAEDAGGRMKSQWPEETRGQLYSSASSCGGLSS